MKMKTIAMLSERVMFAILAASMLAIAVIPSEAGVCPQDGERGQMQPAPAMVRLTHVDSEGTSYFSGALVDVQYSAGVIVTCAHAFDGEGTTTAYFYDGSSAVAKILEIDKLWDIAILEVSKTGIQPVKIAAVHPQAGETVRGYGYGFAGKRFGRTSGVVRGYTKFTDQPSEQTILFTGEVESGDSGGPVLNSKCELVGIITNASTGFSYAIRSAMVEKVISRVIRRIVPVLPRGPPQEGDLGDSGSGGIIVPDEAKPAPDAAGEPGKGIGIDLGAVAGLAIKAAAVVAAGGATGGTGYIGYLAIQAALMALKRRSRRKKRAEVADAADSFSRAAREDEEARQLLQLSALEGRSPLFDAIVGRFAFDELDNIVDGSDDESEVIFAQKLIARLKNRFNNVAPLSVKGSNS